MIKTLLWIVFFCLVIISQSFAVENIAPALNLDGDGIALQGYDPVSYHNLSPEKGRKDLSVEYAGAVYLFTNPDNQKTFNNSPETYLPAFGGWCAWAMLDGEHVNVDPETFKIINGRAYLFYNSFFTNTLTKWNTLAVKETEQILADKAQSEWETLQPIPNSTQ